MATEGDNLMVYVTSGGLSTEAVRKLLWTKEMGDAELLVIKDLARHSAQQACQYHRENFHPGSSANSKLFIVFDAEEPESRGVLVVNLGEGHGRADAVRQLPATAALSVASLSIANTDWYEERIHAFGRKEGPLAVEHFALYNLLSIDQASAMDAAAQAIDEGLQNVTGDDDTGAEPGPSSGPLKRYNIITPEHKDMNEVLARHKETAAALGLNQSFFAVVDDQREKKGTLVVRADDAKDELRCKGPADGELLWWIAIGFMTWDDAREFARRETQRVAGRA